MTAPRADLDVLAGRKECDRIADHTPIPPGVGYMEFSRARHAAGERPRQCDGCGLYVIWRPMA